MNSDKHPQTADTAHSEPNRAVNDGTNFIDAQLAYAKSKQSKQQKRKYYQQKHWQTGKANSKQVTGGDNDKR